MLVNMNGENKMSIEEILRTVWKIKVWAELGCENNDGLPGAEDLIIVCDEIIKMIERQIDDLK